MKILAFDIGIKNLAWALLDRECPGRAESIILGLANDNIMLGNCDDEATAVATCHSCRSRGAWQAGSILACKRHIPDGFMTISGDNMPTLPELRGMMMKEELGEFKKMGGRRGTALDILGRRLAFPVARPKAKKAGSLQPEELHDAIRAFIGRRWEFFCQADVVALENQPAFKNPHMKTVQILLFSSLREEFIRRGCGDGSGNPLPPFHFIHAKKKVQEAQKGDAGYSERKAKSEERVTGLYRDGRIRGWEETWQGAKKKSDMADAICMCCDFAMKAGTAAGTAAAAK